jgi:UDP-N-acetyl-D-glucosamine dehydrogenase
VPIRQETVAAYDCVLVATDHDAFDYELIASHARLIVDSRGRFRHRNAPHVVRA